MDSNGLNKELQKFASKDRQVLPNLNNPLDMDSVNNILSQEHYVPKKRDSFGDNDMRRLEEENLAIDGLIGKIETGSLKYNESELKKELLEAKKGRNISQILLNSKKFWGDSEKMDNLKNALSKLERWMGYENHSEIDEKTYDKLCKLYTDAIGECEKYINGKNPWLSTGKKRMERVKATYANLKREMEQLDYAWEVYSENKERRTDDEKEHRINSGVALLQYGRLAKVVNDEMIGTTRSDIKRTEEALKIAQDYFDAAKLFCDTDYEKLRERKTKEKEEQEKAKKAEKERKKKEREEARKNLPEGGEIEDEDDEEEEEESTFSWFLGFIQGRDELKYDKDVQEAEKERDRRRQQTNYDQRKQNVENLQKRLDELKKQESELDKKADEEEKNDKRRSELKRRESRENAGRNLEKLPDALKELVGLINDNTALSDKFKDKKKLNNEDKEFVRDMVAFKDALADFADGKAMSRIFNMGGNTARIYQDRFGNLSLRYGDNSVSLKGNGHELFSSISRDIVFNAKLYGEDAALNVMQQMPDRIREMDASDLINIREFAAEILHRHLGVRKGNLGNIPVEDLKRFAEHSYDVIGNKTALENLRREIDQRGKQKNGQINSVLNQELHRVMDSSDNVVFLKQDEPDKGGWSDDEYKVREFLADLFYSSDTWSTENESTSAEDKLKEIIRKNSEAVAIILSEQFKKNPLRKKGAKKDNTPGILDNMLDSMGLFEEPKKEGDLDVKKLISTNINSICDTVYKTVMGDEKASEDDFRVQMMQTPQILGNIIKSNYKKIPGESLTDLATTIDETVKRAMDEVQGKFEKCIDKIFSDEGQEGGSKRLQKGDKWVPTVLFEIEEVQKQINESRGLSEEQAKKELEVKRKYNIAKNTVARLDNEYFKPGLTKDEKDKLDKKYKAAVEKETALKKQLDEFKKIDAEENKEKNKVKVDTYKLVSKKSKLVGETTRWDDNEDGDITKKYESILKENRANEKNRKNDPKYAEAEQFKKDKKRFDEALLKYNKTLPAEIEKAEKEKNAKEARKLKRKYDQLGEWINSNSDAIKAGMKKQRMAEIEERIDYRKKNMYSSKELDNLILKKAHHENKLAKLKDRIAKRDYKTDKKHTPEGDKAKISEFNKQITTDEKNIKHKKLELEKAELNKILGDAVKGKQGQGLFTKNVLRTYFKSMPITEQRSMVAGALRNMKNGKAVRKAGADDMDEMSDILGGMFKGAGPLFQKMLQGIPTQELPEGLKKAISDTQDSLAPIPEEVVKNHLKSIIKRSSNKIERIEVVNSLGAASVGQAFLCRVYGPAFAEGKNVVVKLLRPDVRQKMEREKQIMLSAAKMTDRDGMTPAEIREMEDSKRIGGMEATYLGNLKRIEEELDLNIEVENCKKGAIYDKKIEGSKEENLCTSMKMSDLAEPTSDSCIMEIAGNKTLKRYIAELNDKMASLEKYFETDTDEKGKKLLRTTEKGELVLKKNLGAEAYLEIESIKKDLEKGLADAKERQKGLLQLSEKWVTEGIYEKGYYHGDLHAGNIMVGEKGITVIDFGNATELDSTQQKYVIRMMAAAAMGEVEMFRSSFHALLQNTPEEVYQSKRDELTLALKEVLKMGNASSTGERIAVALTKAQELGLELPPVVANFSSGQLRLQNTVTDMNNMLKSLQNTCKLLSHTELQRDRYQEKIDLVYSGLGHAKKLDDILLAKARVAGNLKRYDLITEESFKKELNEATDTKAFCEKHRIDRGLSEEKERLNRILRHEEYFTYEEETNIHINVDGVGLKKAFPKLYEFVQGTSLGQASLVGSVFDYLAMMVRDRMEYKAGSAGAYILNRSRVMKDPKEDKAAVGTERLGAPLNGFKNKDPKAKNATKWEKKYFNSVDELIAYIRENDEKAVKGWRDAKTLIPEKEEDGDGIYSKIDKLIEDKKNKKISKEEYDKSTGQIWEEYKVSILEEANSEAHSVREQFLKDMKKIYPVDTKGKIRENLPERFNRFKLALENIYTYNDSAEFKKRGQEMLSEYEKCLKDTHYAESNAKAIRKKFNEFSVLMLDNAVIATKNLSEKLTKNDIKNVNKYDTAVKPKDFLDVMGGVIDKYLTRTFFQLGIKGNYKARKALKKSGVVIK
ncbi:MAG: hypothetical protein IJ695_01275 [Butyrivibrio sp.]|nr:hypothetical protein [Butyrivibrio sp.]